LPLVLADLSEWLEIEVSVTEMLRKQALRIV
jgi:hypothetical protein